MGRIFWDFLREKYWTDQVAYKIQKKLSKIKVRTDEDGHLFFRETEVLGCQKRFVMLFVFAFIFIFAPSSAASSVTYDMARQQ